jgi:uncharacterized phage protein gp47/JayE
MTQLTTSGFTKSTLAERIAQLQSIWQSALGATIDVDPESPDGQIIGALAEMFANLDDIAEATYNGLLPDGAMGDFLTRLMRLNGIERNAGAYSTAACTFTGTAGTVIQTTALVRSTEEQDPTITWSPIATVTISGGGTQIGTLKCNTPGDKQAPSETLTKIRTVIPGWTAVNNPADATRGYLTETDERARARRARSVAAPSQSITDGMYAAILNLENVSQVVVWENEQDTAKTMPGGSLVPHSVFAVVDGGDQDQIANAIWLRKSVGCTMMGSVARTITDAQGHDHIIRFSRPTDVDVYIEIDVTKRAGWVDGSETTIADAIVAASEEPGAVPIGGDSNNEFAWSDVLAWIAKAGIVGYSVTAVRMGSAPSPTTPWQNVAIAYDAIARFETAHITVTAT